MQMPNAQISPPIHFAPATPLVSKDGVLVGWQRQLDFRRIITPLALPELIDGKKPRHARLLKWVVANESEEQRQARITKGVEDRTAFMDWIEFGVCTLKNGKRLGAYKRFLDIAKNEVRHLCLSTHTKRHLKEEDTDDLAMDIMHSVIDKVAELLSDGLYAAHDGRFDNYFFAHLKPDIRRAIIASDEREKSTIRIYQQEDGDVWGDLGEAISESPTFLEADKGEAISYVKDKLGDALDSLAASDPESASVTVYLKLRLAGENIPSIARLCKVRRKDVTEGLEHALVRLRDVLDIQPLMEMFERNATAGGCGC